VITLITAVAVGLLTGRVVGSWMNRYRKQATMALKAPRPSSQQQLTSATDDRLKGLPCALGDVIVLAHGEEAWLAGAILLRERVAHADGGGDPTRTAAALFVAPDRERERAVYACPDPASTLDWLWPVSPDALTMGHEPPSALEHEGERFERTRRLPLALTLVGEGAPDLGVDAVVGEYEGGSGARLLVVIGRGATRIWRGRRLEQGMYDVLPGSARVPVPR